MIAPANAWFEDADPLNRRFVIYLPSRRKDGSPIQGHQDLADAAARLFCDLFGGVTSYPATGLFLRSNGEAQQEPVVALEAYCDAGKWERNSAFVHQTTALLAHLLNQESIACSLDGRLTFVEPHNPSPGANDDDEAAVEKFLRWLPVGSSVRGG